MTGQRVMIYVQHLLGVGHLRRAALLADAMVASGMRVTLVSGGLPVPGLQAGGARFVQLPPVAAADATFKSLVDEEGAEVDEEWKNRRRDRLLATWRECAPDALVFELFPFGRRQMRFELLPLLDAVARLPVRPLVVSSVRDVLGAGQKDPTRQDRMLALFERHFDRVLVHGDVAVLPFDRTFRHAGRIGERLSYTGYVVAGGSGTPPAPDPQGPGANEVLVSVGGGAVGRPLLDAALAAKPLCTLAGLRWRLLAGSAIDDTSLAALRARVAAAGGDVVIERNRGDFRQLLANCRLSISQAGYNTVMETLHAGTRAVVVPFAGGGEIEQELRARLLAERGWLDLLPESELAPASLARAIDLAAARGRVPRGVVQLDGARRSAELVARWLAERAR